jgi:Pyridoxamine 5'-phosphate oxidase
MSEREPTTVTNLDRYGNQALLWSRARAALMGSSASPDVTFFLGTIGPDGKPHAAGVGGLWHDGDLFFPSGPKMRKSRDLAANPTCTMSVRLGGIDLVLEGSAVRVTDGPTLEVVAARYRENGWPAEVARDAFTAPYTAPSAGPPPWYLYRFTPRAVTGVAGAEPHGATRWTF